MRTRTSAPTSSPTAGAGHGQVAKTMPLSSVSSSAHGVLLRDRAGDASLQRARSGRCWTCDGRVSSSAVTIAQFAVVAEEAGDLRGWGAGPAPLGVVPRRPARRRSGPAACQPAPTPRRDRGRPPGSRARAPAGTPSSPRAGVLWTRRRARRTARPSSRISGSTASTRARCTRRRSPPESDGALAVGEMIDPAAPSSAAIARSRRSRARTPHQASASSMFLSAVRCAMSAGLQRDRETTVAGDGAGVGWERPGQAVEQGALAGAVRAEQSDDLTGMQLEARRRGRSRACRGRRSGGRIAAMQRPRLWARSRPGRARKRNSGRPGAVLEQRVPPSRTSIRTISTIPKATASAYCAALASYRAALARVWS